MEIYTDLRFGYEGALGDHERELARATGIVEVMEILTTFQTYYRKSFIENKLRQVMKDNYYLFAEKYSHLRKHIPNGVRFYNGYRICTRYLHGFGSWDFQLKHAAAIRACFEKMDTVLIMEEGRKLTCNYWIKIFNTAPNVICNGTFRMESTGGYWIDQDDYVLNLNKHFYNYADSTYCPYGRFHARSDRCQLKSFYYGGYEFHQFNDYVKAVNYAVYLLLTMLRKVNVFKVDMEDNGQFGLHIMKKIFAIIQLLNIAKDCYDLPFEGLNYYSDLCETRQYYYSFL